MTVRRRRTAFPSAFLPFTVGQWTDGIPPFPRGFPQRGFSCTFIPVIGSVDYRKARSVSYLAAAFFAFAFFFFFTEWRSAMPGDCEIG